MSKSKPFSFRLFSIIVAVLVVMMAFPTSPHMDISAQTICVSPFGYNHPDDEND